jgi:hypothetical protein
MLMDDQRVGREKYKIPGTPVTIILDRKGRMIFKHVGYGPGLEKTFEAEIRLLLEREG